MTQNCKCKGSKDTVNDSGIVCCAVCFLPIPEENEYDDWELAPETRIVNVYQKKLK